MSETFEIHDSIPDVECLERVLTTPPESLVECFRTLEGDVLILGAGGKMGPTLAVMAQRATQAAGVDRRIVGVSRFSQPESELTLNQAGVETIRCDLLDPGQVAALPNAANLVFMAGMKFGTTGQESMTWTLNTVLPGIVARRFPGSRFVVFSTGNVYPLTPIDQGGSRETDPPEPLGEYAASCLGRERVFAYYATALGSPTVIARLNYANELRYGVLVDLAMKVWYEQPIDLTMGYVNVIWQGDACSMILRSLEHTTVPASILNVVGPDTLRVRDLAEQFGQLMNKPVRFTGSEAPDALLSNGQRGYERLGRPEIDPRQMIRWIADWVMRDGHQLARPTHFECRDGKF
ncbi:MAG: NAD(P)-dependent oxidoreductase [Pirellulales bacterium]|nr:NAD(P)-dependent oxidoreductase [Pirellulales bacterium]